MAFTKNKIKSKRKAFFSGIVGFFDLLSERLVLFEHLKRDTLLQDIC
jgi:hypothetical protein